jgi:hypothetical protein
MGRIIRLVLVAAFAWAAWNGGLAAWRQFQFSDEVKRIAQFGPDKDPESIKVAVMQVAAALELPVVEPGIRIRQQERPPSLEIDVSYTVQIEILPRVYYPWTFTASAHGWFVPGGRAPVR